jgi:hypothetical protein
MTGAFSALFFFGQGFDGLFPFISIKPKPLDRTEYLSVTIVVLLISPNDNYLPAQEKTASV